MNLRSFTKVACLENLSDYRRQFADMLQRLPEVKKSSKTPKPESEAPASDSKSDALKPALTGNAPAAQDFAVPPQATKAVLPPCPPPAAVLRPISCWNNKGTWEEVRELSHTALPKLFSFDFFTSLASNSPCISHLRWTQLIGPWTITQASSKI